MSDNTQNYPYALERLAIEKLVPHRGDIFVCQRLIIEGPYKFTGTAHWPLDNGLIRGHFPGLPVVPGVLLIEAAAQLAVAGMLADDPYVKSLTNVMGLLASVRKCQFKKMVLPQRDVEFSIHWRLMAPNAAQVSAIVNVEQTEAARLDMLIAYSHKQQVVDVFNNTAPALP
ncbi:MAG: 3-hydroxyacyl-ACP dehydratase FabZ family protein [Sulfuricaulis sp.]